MYCSVITAATDVCTVAVTKQREHLNGRFSGRYMSPGIKFDIFLSLRVSIFLVFKLIASWRMCASIVSSLIYTTTFYVILLHIFFRYSCKFQLQFSPDGDLILKIYAKL